MTAWRRSTFPGSIRRDRDRVVRHPRRRTHEPRRREVLGPQRPRPARDGTTTTRVTPVDVVGLHGPAAAIATGPYHTCAVLRNGGIDCWGSNATGQLGDGTKAGRSHPAAVAGFGAATATATATVVARRVVVTRKRVAAVAVRCGRVLPCRGTLALTASRKTLGSRRFSTPAGDAQAIRVVLTRSAFARLVRAKRLSAHVSVTGPAAAPRAVTLVAPS